MTPQPANREAVASPLFGLLAIGEETRPLGARDLCSGTSPAGRARWRGAARGADACLAVPTRSSTRLPPYVAERTVPEYARGVPIP